MRWKRSAGRGRSPREELDTGRAALTRGYARNFETAEQVARAAAQMALHDLPDDYYSTFVPRVLAIDEASATTRRGTAPPPRPDADRRRR